MIPQQNTPEWREWRRSRIGASDCPIIMGVSPWKTRRQLWLEKQSLCDEDPIKPCMQKGLDCEEEARQALEKQTGLVFFPKVVIHPEHPWMIASLDGITPEENRQVEIKVPGKRTLAAAAAGIVEEPYMYQVQHQLACTGLAFSYFWVWDHDTQTGFCLTIDRNEDTIAKIIEEETTFWECLQTATPPDDDMKTAS